MRGPSARLHTSGHGFGVPGEGFTPSLPKGTLDGCLAASSDPIPRPWESDNYMVTTAPEASWAGICLVVSETLGHVGRKGAQDEVRGEFLRW